MTFSPLQLSWQIFFFSQLVSDLAGFLSEEFSSSSFFVSSNGIHGVAPLPFAAHRSLIGGARKLRMKDCAIKKNNKVPQMINRRFFMMKNLNFSKKKRWFFDFLTNYGLSFGAPYLIIPKSYKSSNQARNRIYKSVYKKFYDFPSHTLTCD
ncbi:hypothetical protein BpHYR1_051881 [Brachionus plicatilis]|uniref:Uncharacterized protein n=1 Tax=Brachionus plicatilis TaxID=10195 RepID=A0A3M7RLN4_BRAPC|nr:hypothetical protein BpHYR1_051881 [Brachionus plicatilis]